MKKKKKSPIGLWCLPIECLKVKEYKILKTIKKKIGCMHQW